MQRHRGKREHGRSRRVAASSDGENRGLPQPHPALSLARRLSLGLPITPWFLESPCITSPATSCPSCAQDSRHSNLPANRHIGLLKGKAVVALCQTYSELETKGQPHGDGRRPGRAGQG